MWADDNVKTDDQKNRGSQESVTDINGYKVD